MSVKQQLVMDILHTCTHTYVRIYICTHAQSVQRSATKQSVMDIVYIRLMDIVYIRYVRMHTHAQSVQRSASQQFVILATDGLWDVVSSQVCGEGKEEEEEEFLSKEVFLSSSSSFLRLSVLV